MIFYLSIFIATTPVSNKSTWPELVGTIGKDAVQIIKKETGKYAVLYRKIYFKN